MGQDTTTFDAALRHVLRQDPNVILIGELRDLETIQAALTIAETGHLVLATLHTTDCAQTINRIIDVFPQHQLEQVRVQLSFVLQAVLCQQLLAHASGAGRVLACETLIVNAAIRNLIREQKVEQIQVAIQTGGKVGMQTMNQGLAELYCKQKITFQEAMSHSLDPEDLRRLHAAADDRAGPARKERLCPSSPIRPRRAAGIVLQGIIDADEQRARVDKLRAQKLVVLEIAEKPTARSTRSRR